MKECEIFSRAALYGDLLRARNCTPKHASDTQRRILDVLTAIDATCLTDLRPTAIQVAINPSDHGGLTCLC